MADGIIPTFIAEEIPPATQFTQSGKSLRLSYVIRAQAKYIGEILIERQDYPLNPTIDIENYDERTWEDLRDTWKKEAELKYPDEGDYVVQIVDPDTGLPVPLGEMFIFVGGDVRDVPGGQPCIVYNWDLSGVIVDDPSIEVMTIIYTDCFNISHTLTETVDNWGPNYEICANSPDITITGGVITPGTNCDLTYKMCTQYFLDVTGVPPLDPVTVNSIDCDGVSTVITGSATSIQKYFCAQIDTITTSVGTLVLQETCSGGIPIDPTVL